jgi:hypothetical protein
MKVIEMVKYSNFVAQYGKDILELDQVKPIHNSNVDENNGDLKIKFEFVELV